MKKLSFLLILQILISGILIAQKSTENPNVKLSYKVIENGCGGNIIQVDNVAASINYNLNVEERNELKAELEKKYGEYSKGVYKNALSIYESEKTKANFTKVVAEANKIKWEIVGEIASDIAKASPELESKAVIKALTFGGKKVLDYTTDYLKEQADKARRNSLDGLLFNIRKENKAIINRLQTNPNMDDESFTNLIFKSNAANEEFYNNLEESDKADYVKHMHNELKDAVKGAVLKNLGRDKLLAQRIVENQKMIKDIEVGLKKDLEITNRNVVSLINSQEKMKVNLESLSQDVNLNTRDLDFIKDYLYGRMNPAEKLAAINHGFLDKLPPDEQRKERQKIELLKAQQEFLETTREYLGGTQNVLTIARNLGIESPLLDKAQDAVNMANVGMEAFSQFTTGNYLGAVTSLSGLFGKKTDPTNSKLIMIERKLDKILDNQEIMKRQLIEIQEGLDKLIKGQITLQNTLIDISDRIDKQYYSLYQKLQDMHLDILYNRNQIHYYSSERQLATIHAFILHDKSLLDLIADSIPDYYECLNKIIIPNMSQLNNFENSLQNEFNVIRNQNKAELEAKQKIFEIPRNFKMNEFYRYDDPLKEINKATVINLLRLDTLFKYYIAENKIINPKKYYAAMLIPFIKCSDLSKKTSLELSDSLINSNESIKEIINFLDCDFSSKLKDERNNNYLEPRYLVEATNDLINFYYLYSFLNNKIDTISLEMVVSGKAIYNAKVEILKKARFLINIGISQQIMLSGDLLIPYIYQKLNKGLIYPPDSINSDESQKQRLCLRILENNDLARYNFLKYYVSKRLEKLGRSIANYSVGLSLSNKMYLQQTLNVVDSIDWNTNPIEYQQLKLVLVTDPRDEKKQIWSYAIPTSSKDYLYFPMPSSTDETDKKLLVELKENKMAYRNSLDELLKYKQYLDKQISKIEFINRVPDKEKTNLYKIILYSNLSD